MFGLLRFNQIPVSSTGQALRQDQDDLIIGRSSSAKPRLHSTSLQTT